MSKRKGLISLLPFLALVVLLMSGVVLAQTGSGYDLSWSTVDGGGYTFSTGHNRKRKGVSHPQEWSTLFPKEVVSTFPAGILYVN